MVHGFKLSRRKKKAQEAAKKAKEAREMTGSKKLRRKRKKKTAKEVSVDETIQDESTFVQLAPERRSRAESKDDKSFQTPKGGDNLLIVEGKPVEDKTDREVKTEHSEQPKVGKKKGFLLPLKRV
jgi:hypothetical protein